MTIPPPGVRDRTWTKAEYYRLGELGFFHGQRVELMEGKLMVMSPQGSTHRTAVLLAAHLLDTLFQPQCHAQAQMPLDLSPTTEPEPDVAVVAGQVRDYTNAHPTHALLVVEVSDTSLAYDRGRKASLYASAGILDYWIVNLVTPQIEVYRNPIPDANEPFGHRYGQRTDYLPGQLFAPLALPNARIAVTDLLP